MKNIENFGITDGVISTKNSIYCDDKDSEVIEEMISKVDKNAVFAILDSAAKYFDNCSTTMDIVEKYLHLWASAKYEFYLMFGRTFKAVKEVEFPVNPRSIYEKFVKTFYVEHDKNGNDTSRFQTYWMLAKHFSEREVVENKMDSDEDVQEFLGEYYTPEMKLSRFLSMYFNDTAFDIELSKVYQNKKIRGQNVLSIDPIDYLMSAINKNNWSTCHNMSGGCHADGPLALMLDNSTLICYNSSKEVHKYSFGSHVVENISMRYRSCVYMNKNDLSFAVGRCYPNCSDERIYKEFADFVQGIASEYTHENEWFVETVTENMDNGDCNGAYALSDDKMTRIHKNPQKRYVVNGGRLTFVDPIKYFCALESRKKSKIFVGANHIPCLRCGEMIESMYDNKKALCKKCADKVCSEV